jgi:hypothetical protein
MSVKTIATLFCYYILKTRGAKRELWHFKRCYGIIAHQIQIQIQIKHRIAPF